MTYSILKKKKDYIGKTNLDVLQALLDKLQLCQQALEFDYIGENQLIAATQKVYYRVYELEFALFTPITTFKEFFFKLQLFIITYNNRNTTNIQYFTDHRFKQYDYKNQYNKGNNTYNHYNNNNNNYKL